MGETIPYIHQDLRSEIDAEIDALAAKLIGRKQGVINYAISRLLREWNGPVPHYSDYNESLGVLEGVKLELARDLARYEDQAKLAHGPLPTPRARP